MAGKTSFFKKVIGRLEQLDPQGLRVVLERLASERSFLETLFNAIEDGVLVVDENGADSLFQPGGGTVARLNAGRRGRPADQGISAGTGLGKLIAMDAGGRPARDASGI